MPSSAAALNQRAIDRRQARGRRNLSRITTRRSSSTCSMAFHYDYGSTRVSSACSARSCAHTNWPINARPLRASCQHDRRKCTVRKKSLNEIWLNCDLPVTHNLLHLFFKKSSPSDDTLSNIPRKNLVSKISNYIFNITFGHTIFTQLTRLIAYFFVVIILHFD